MCLPNILSPVFMFAFIFHCRLFSPCWLLAFLIASHPFWIFMFFFLQNSSLLFLITCSSSFSQITAKKTRLCCCLIFLSKVFFFPNKTLSCIWVAIPVDWIILHWYACGADKRLGAIWRSVYGHVITKFSRMGSLPHFFTHGTPLYVLRMRQLHY